MDLLAQIKEAFGNLFTAKLQSFLAILGILVGTGSVVAMVSSGQLATEAALAQFKQLGTNLLSVSIMDQEQSKKQGSGEPDTDFTLAQAQGISKVSSNIQNVAPYTTTYAPILYNGHKLHSGSILGATESLAPTVKISMNEGRFVSDLDGVSNYCFIGDKLKKELQKLGAFNIIGTQLQVGKFICIVAGVANKWPESSFMNSNINDALIVPIKDTLEFSKYAKINSVILTFKPGTNLNQLQQQITDYISRVAPAKKLFFRSPAEIIKSMRKQSDIFTLLLACIAGISLLVGGIGVMNIMLVSVVERRREIGIRMAIGARRRDIQLLFLLESITLSLFGGTIGVIFGITASLIICLIAGWSFSILLMPPVLGFVVSVAVGIFFGFYPAYQASQLDPIQTLRSD